MNVLKLFGIVRVNNKKSIIAAIGTLLWFGIATNGLYDLWKLLATISITGTPDWANIFLASFPAVSFIVWITYIYRKFSQYFKESSAPDQVSKAVSSHKGIVLALSKPRKSPEEIIELVRSIDSKDMEVLYSEQSIGQLFKGLYYHKAALRHVWPLTTPDSMPYRECIKEFVMKFLPQADVCGKEEGPRDICRISGGGDLELIEQTKTILSNIYSEAHLNDLGLSRSDIIVDITGGTKSITIGLIFGALDSAIDIQYVEQQSKKYDVIPLSITPEMILDKAGEYLIQLYSKMQEKRGSA